MTMKDWLQQLRPIQLYIVLVLSITYFLVQLFMSHITHALTLLVDAYHMLCNIIALAGCIITIKHCNKKPPTAIASTSGNSVEEKTFVEVCVTTTRSERDNPERTLRNTFGWARIDVLTMLIVCIFLASMSFSLLVEALQTLIHIDHQDTIHHPVSVLVLGVIGLVLNAICYTLIGGYTFHQGSFLHITPSGDVVLDRVLCDKSIRQDDQRNATNGALDATVPGKKRTKRAGFLQIFRDISSSVFVIICCIVVYTVNDENVAKYIDPIISMVSCIVLLVLSYPYMKESCFILLQTIPNSIDIEQFKMDLMKKFQDIVSVHDLHIWQLTAGKCVSTAHIIFQNPNVYLKIMEDVRQFFHEQGITIVTIQPEFKQQDANNALTTTTTTTSTTDIRMESMCLMECPGKDCVEKSCCKQNEQNICKKIKNEPVNQVDNKQTVCLDVTNLSQDCPIETKVISECSQTVSEQMANGNDAIDSIAVCSKL